MNINPLVSVVVITYNSAKTVLDTLDSIAAQTYDNIELIISDDCSKDNTVEVIRIWLNNHRKRFIRTKLIISESNTGTSENLNRGYLEAASEWIKSIAGDDVLINTCIESNVNYIERNPNVEILLSKVKLLGSPEIIKNYGEIFNYETLSLKRRDLLFLLLISNFLPAPTLFIKKEVYTDIGGFDNRMPLLEDWPFWIKALIKNKTISFNPDFTVYYRISENSVSLTSNPNQLYLKSLNFFYDEFLPYYQWKISKLLWLYCKANRIVGKPQFLYKVIRILLKFFNPITYYLIYLNWKVRK